MASLLDDTTAPRSLISLSEYRDRVRGDLGQTDSTLLTDANINNWGNEAQDRLARVLRWYRTFDTMGTVAGTKEYALPAPVAGRCIQIEEVRYDTEQLYVTTLPDLMRWDPNYVQAGNGRPEWYYLRGNSGFGLHSTPDTTDADILVVVYVGLPPHISANDEHFYVPPGGEDFLLAFGKWRASQKDVYGEGARRVAEFRQEMAEVLRELQRQVDQAGEREEVALGADGLDVGIWGNRIPFHTTITEP